MTKRSVALINKKRKNLLIKIKKDIKQLRLLGGMDSMELINLEKIPQSSNVSSNTKHNSLGKEEK